MIQNFSVASGTVTLSWNSEAGVHYGVASSSNLASGIWQTILTVPGNGAMVSTNFTATANAGEEFFKLIIE